MKNNNVTKLIQASIFLALAMILQIIGRNFVQINPILIGPLISTIIFLTTYISGLSLGILIGILIPLLGILIGVVAGPFIPFVPVMILGNIILIITFGILMYKGRTFLYAGIALSSILRYLFMTFASQYLINIFNLNIPQKILQQVLMLLSTPQLINALIGGIIAIIIIEILNKRKLNFLKNLK
ncbi:ECF transporter S component [Aceticella autotrophica]|uniref:ECF transporter S component n=1 Tax=Aceticella autotrophica TaxID=2755338 RepID=A0A975AUM9_9THEO|nr:ECF transporter S component [Aceticella autotrophica]QSZ26751.1 ECF transporter S component [Aceticella autotrophica]